MYAIPKNQLIQQAILASHVNHLDSYQFFNLLTSPELLAVVEAHLPEHRERLFPPTETLSIFLAQALSTDSSCQKAVNESAVKRLLNDLPLCSTYTGAYCKARQRLPEDLISALTQHIAGLVDEQVPDLWRWRGRTVRLIDGTSFYLPDTFANQLSFPQSSSQQSGLGFPKCRMVGVICLSSGVVLAAAMSKMQGKGTTEQTLIRELIDVFKTGDIVLGDAFYSSYFLMADLHRRGVDIVFEQYGARKRSTDFRKGKRLGERDHLITLPKPKKPDWMTQEQYDDFPASLTVRELKTGGKILVTSLLNPRETSKKAISKLYQSRWDIEVDFRHIKTTLGMEMLSCKTPDMIIKEIWVYLLAYNLIRLLMSQSALQAGLVPRQLSFKHAVQLWIAWSHQQRGTDIQENINLLMVMMAQCRVGNRPGRCEPRALKRRPKAFPMLMKPRAIARADVRKNGHPKKIKA